MTFDEWWLIADCGGDHPNGTEYLAAEAAWNAAQAEALALLRELNDALAIPGWLQARVDAVLDRAGEKA